MAAKETRSSEKTLKILSDLSQEHEMLILKRQALLQIQKHIEKETDLRLVYLVFTSVELSVFAPVLLP